MSGEATHAPAAGGLRQVVLVTGISGSGKSVALHALEDAGLFCVDNLPPELLRDFLRLEHERSQRRVAIAVDVRSAGSLPHLLPLLEQLRAEGVAINAVFLDATTDALVRRFSETRRRHPLSAEPRTTGAKAMPAPSWVVRLPRSCRRIRLPSWPWQIAQEKSCGPERR